ncbi:MAG: BatA domain-containing protein [Verrucomicrobiales bacterium]|nr:BatA domain-containing protein [Verrucomicrobiales bacterium]
MTFLAPFYFWTFLALIPLLGVYFLKVRPRRVTTTALFLWMRIYEEKRRTAIFRRLRDLFSLSLSLAHRRSLRLDERGRA